MQSRIPPAAVTYFERMGVDLAENHPVVSAAFRPGSGWAPLFNPQPVSHMYLLQLRDAGVTDVQLKADGRIPDFGIKELIGNMGPIDAEMIDGIPITEGSGAVLPREPMITLLLTIFREVPQDKLNDFITQVLGIVDEEGAVEFSNTSRSPIGAFEEATRYRLSRRGELDGVPAYELSVLVYEKAEA
jgi:hypothetical protein